MEETRPETPKAETVHLWINNNSDGLGLDPCRLGHHQRNRGLIITKSEHSKGPILEQPKGSNEGDRNYMHVIRG
jgi:hypothetical protein